MNIFVAGTGTGVGKTLVCAWLALHNPVGYWKPIQCGLDDETDSQLVARLSGVSCYPERFRLAAPRSPHVAARQENISIDAADFQIPPSPAPMLVEGAGGLFVPINEREMMIDIVASLGLPVLLVASGSLGTINHSLLSIAALRARQIPLLGVVFTGELLPENGPSISAFGNTEILGHLPTLGQIDRAALLHATPPDLAILTAKQPVP